MKYLRFVVLALAAAASGGCDEMSPEMKQEELVVDVVARYAAARTDRKVRQEMQAAYREQSSSGIIDDGSSIVVILLRTDEAPSTEYEIERALNQRLDEWRTSHKANIVLVETPITRQETTARFVRIGTIVEYLKTDTVQVR